MTNHSVLWHDVAVNIFDIGFQRRYGGVLCSWRYGSEMKVLDVALLAVRVLAHIILIT